MARRGRRTSARNHCVVDLRAEPALDLARPRRLGELVEAAFSLFWRHRAVFLTVSLIVVAPAVILVDGVWGRALVNGVDAKEPSDAVAASRLLGTFVIPPLVTALHVRIVQGLAQGRTPSVGDAVRAAGARIMPAAGAVALYALVVIGGTLLFVVPGVYVAVAMCFAAQSAVVDEARPAEALRRSRDLVLGHWWWTAGRLIALALISLLVAAVLGSVVGSVAAALGGAVLSVAALVVVEAIALSIGALFGTLLFFDLRARRAGPPRPA